MKNFVAFVAVCLVGGMVMVYLVTEFLCPYLDRRINETKRHKKTNEC